MDRDEVVAVSGASMGAFTAYAFSADKLDEYEKIFSEINIKNLARRRFSLKRLIRDICASFIKSDDVLQCPMCFPLCRIPLWNTKYCWIKGKGNRLWRKYFASEVALPFFTWPVFLEGKLCIDGGAVDNIPIYPILNGFAKLTQDRPDLIIALHFDSKFDWRNDLYSQIPICDLDLTMSNGFSHKHFDFSVHYVREMIEKGCEYGRKICDKLFAPPCDSASLKRAIDEIFLEEHEARMKNSAADRWVTNLNIIGKALRDDSDCIKYLF